MTSRMVRSTNPTSPSPRSLNPQICRHWWTLSARACATSRQSCRGWARRCMTLPLKTWLAARNGKPSSCLIPWILSFPNLNVGTRHKVFSPQSAVLRFRTDQLTNLTYLPDLYLMEKATSDTKQRLKTTRWRNQVQTLKTTKGFLIIIFPVDSIGTGQGLE